MDATFTHIHWPLPRPITRDVEQSHFCLSTGVSPFIPVLSRTLRLEKQDLKSTTTKHHISIMLPLQIQFGLFRFRSPLLAESRLISLPRPTQMLHFGRFALPGIKQGSIIERPHSDILRSKVACTYPRLIAACHVLHHFLSLVIHQPA